MGPRGAGDPRELLRIWMQWEEGETTPGKVMSDLKLHGMRELLDSLVEQLEPGDDARAGDSASPDPETSGDPGSPVPPTEA